MFKQRLLTALVLIPLVLAIIFYAPSWLLLMMAAIFLIVAGWEWTQLIPLHARNSQVIFLLSLSFLSWLSLSFLFPWLYVGLIGWGLIFVSVVTFPNSKRYWGYKPVVGLLGLLLLPLLFSSLVTLFQQPQGSTLLVYLLFLVWAADSGAYLAGKRFGKRKLIPQVSPGKTWEGTLGGVCLGLLVAMLGYLYFKPASILCWFIIAISTILISILGDLFISILKRRCQLKDTGQIFPGHGGMLDRIDSLVAALPWFYFAIKCLPNL